MRQVIEKTLCPMVICLALLAPTALGGLNWTSDLETARQDAARENKLVLIHFVMNNCGACVNMEHKVFSQPAVSRTVLSGFVPVRINRHVNPELARQFRVQRFPTDIIMTPQGKVLAELPYTPNPNQYISGLRRIAPQIATARAPERDARPPEDRYSRDIGSPPESRWQQRQDPMTSTPDNNWNERPTEVNSRTSEDTSYEPRSRAPREDNPNSFSETTDRFERQDRERSPQRDTRDFQDPDKRWQDRPEQQPDRQPTRGWHDPGSTNTPEDNSRGFEGQQDTQRETPPRENYKPDSGSSLYHRERPSDTPTGRTDSARDLDKGERSDQQGPPPWEPRNDSRPSSPSGDHLDDTTPDPGQAAIKGAPPIALNGYCSVSLVDWRLQLNRDVAAKSKEKEESSYWSKIVSWGGGDKEEEKPKVKPLQKGDKLYGVIHRGRTYLFKGPEQQKRFLAAPDLYAPVLEGFDPVSYLDNGKLVEGKYRFGVFYRERIHLFSTEENRNKFEKNRDQYGNRLGQVLANEGTAAKSKEFNWN